MNKIFRSIYNETLGAWVAVGETTKARGQKSSSTKAATLGLLALGVLGALDASAAFTADPCATPLPGNTASGKSSYAFGCDITIPSTAPNTVVLGTHVTATQANSVLLGNRTTDRAATIESGLTINGITYNYAGKSNVDNGVVSFGATNLERQLINVAAGKVSSTSTDAVNGSQLNATNLALIASQIHFFSVNSTGSTGDNYTNDGAAGADAIAVGKNAKAGSNNSIAIGLNAISPNNPGAINNIAIGSGATTGLIISGSTSGGQIALGNGAKTDTQGAIAIGEEATATGYHRQVAIGWKSSSLGNSSVALGREAKVDAHANQAVAIGAYANATSINAVAIGNSAKSAALSAVAIGNSATASKTRAIAIGGDGANLTTASGVDTIAIGSKAEASGTSSISIGTGNKVAGNNSGAMGSPSIINGANAYSIGNNNTIGSTTSNAFAMGNNVYLGADAAGADTTDVSGAVALGNKSSVTQKSGVALGEGSAASTASGAVGYDTKTGAASTLTTSTWKATNAAVSVGDGLTLTRQITSLAAGTNDTDAVNVAQLKANQTHYYSVNSTNVTAGSNYANDGATGGDSLAAGVAAIASGNNAVAIGVSAVAKNSSTVAIGDSSNAMGIDDINIGRGSGVGSSAKVNNANVHVGAFSGEKVTGESNVGVGVISGRRVTGNSNSALGDGAGQDVTGNRNVAIGYVSGNGVTASNTISMGSSSLASKDNAIAIGSSASATIAGGVALGSGAVASTASGVVGYKPATATTVDKTAIDATQSTLAAVSVGDTGKTRQITNVAAGTVDSDAVNVSQLKAVNTTANKGWDTTTAKTGTGTVTGTSVANVAPGAKVTTTAGNNIAITQSGTDLTIATNPDLVSTSITTGNSKLDTTGLVITGGPSVLVGGIDAGSKVITNVANGAVSATSKDAVNGSQLNAQAVSLTALGLNFTGNDATAGNVHRDLGAILSIKGLASSAGTYSGANLKTVTDPTTGAINLQMAESPVFGATTINAGGTGKITGVTAGTASTDAVNFSQLSAVSTTANKGWDTTTAKTGTGTVTGTSVANVAPGAKVTTTAGNNIAITQSGTDLTIATNPDLVSTSITTGNSKLDTTGLVITGGPSVLVGGIDAGSKVITNVANGAVSATSKDAVNGSQLNAQAVSLTALGLNFTGNDATAGNVHRDLGAILSIKGLASSAGTYSGANLKTVTDPTTGAINLQMAESPVFGATTINAGGTGKITGVTAGTASTDAVNFSQLSAVSTTANKGWDTTTAKTGTGTVTGTSVANVAPGAKVTTTAGNNIAITQSGTDLTIATNPDLVSTSITTGNSKLDTTGLVITGGPSVLVGGIDAGSKVITNVANGAVSATSKDAVNGSQLNAQAVSLTALGLNFTGNDATAGNVHRDLGAILSIKGLASSAGTYSGANLKTVTDPTTGAINLQMAESPVFGATTINAGGTGKITGVTAGTASTDAVNFSQLSAVSTTANKGWDTTTAKSGTGTVTGTSVANVAPGAKVTTTAGNNIAITQSGTDLTIATNPDLVSTSITTGNSKLDTTGLVITGGPSVLVGGIDAGSKVITNVANGAVSATSKDAVNGSQLNAQAVSLTALGLNFTGNDATAGNVHRDLGAILSIKGLASSAGTYSGANLKTVTDPTTGAINLQMAESPVFGATTINAGGTGKITGVTAGTASTDAVNFSQLSAVSTTANKGWDTTTAKTGTGTVTGTSVANVAPGAKVTTTAGNNIAITQSGTDLTIATNPDLVSTSITTGNSKLDTTGLVITGGPSVLVGGIDAGSKVITNVANGAVSATSKDAVNGSQLNAQAVSLTALGLNFTGNDATAGNVHRDLGAILSIKGLASSAGTYSGANLKTVTDPTTGAINLQMAESPVFGATTINAGGTGKITGVTAGTASTDAVNFSQLSAVSTTANKGWDTTTAKSGTGTVTGTSVANVAPGAKVTTTAGNNIAITQSGTDLTIATNPDLVSTSITTGNSKLDTTGLVITGGPSVLVGGIDAGSKVITNVANGAVSATSKDAVNGSQLNAVNSALEAVAVTANAGHKVTTAATGTGVATGTSVTTVAPGAVVTYTAGNNVVIKQNGQEVQFAVSATPSFTSVNTTNLTTTGTTTIGGALNVNAGTVVNMGGNQINNVAAGTAPNDAVNVNQLQSVNAQNIQNINQLRSDINNVARKAYAGIAAAIAMEGAPFVAGKTTYAAGGGYYGGQGAVGVTIRRTADNGRWSITGGISGSDVGGVAARFGVSGVFD